MAKRAMTKVRHFSRASLLRAKVWKTWPQKEVVFWLKTSVWSSFDPDLKNLGAIFYGSR